MVVTCAPAGAVKAWPISKLQLPCTNAPEIGLPEITSTICPLYGPRRSPGSTVSGRAAKGARATIGAPPAPAMPPAVINRRVVRLIGNVGLDNFMIGEEAAPLFPVGGGGP